MPTSCQDDSLLSTGIVCLRSTRFCPEWCVFLPHGIQGEASLTQLSCPVQLRSIPVKGAEDDELEEEADWIYRNAFATPTISLQVPPKKVLVCDMNQKLRSCSSAAPNVCVPVVEQCVCVCTCTRVRADERVFLDFTRQGHPVT